ncbi:methyltransferase [Achromatium sp. WMS2]|nr:methyltransferase [Achromatium sp. WMS2]
MSILHPNILPIPDVILNTPQVWYALSAGLGLLVGSFLNVLVYRLPLILTRRWTQDCTEFLGHVTPQHTLIPTTLSLARPGSHCPECKHPLQPWENIPILSYLWLRGRCSACNTGISLRYPLVEASSAGAALTVAICLGPTWHAGAALILTWGLIALSLIDYDTQLLPDYLTLPLLWLGLLVNTQSLFTTPEAAIWGAVLGYLSLWLVFKVYLWLTGTIGIGHGDFKLLALLGAWLGWHNLPQIIFLSSLVGAGVGTILILGYGHQRNQPIPFGPFLAGAGWINCLWGPTINSVYLTWMGLS